MLGLGLNPKAVRLRHYNQHSSREAKKKDRWRTWIDLVHTVDLAAVEGEVKGSLADILDIQTNDFAVGIRAQGQSRNVILQNRTR